MTTTPPHAADSAAGITNCKWGVERNDRHQTGLARVARLASMGEMAAGLAHELNQPLATAMLGIQASIQSLKAGAAEPAELLARFGHVAKAIERAGKITHSIGAFVSNCEPQRSAISVNDAVREATDLTKADVKWHGVTLGLELADRLPPVQANAIQIEQVILNLVRNGVQAMADPGADLGADPAAGPRSLTIRTSACQSDGREVVEVAVRDTGKGLPEEAADRLFDPFYSTKPDGMGLGLSLSRSIIEAHGGRLWATANPDRGATFRFTLPARSQV